MNAAATMAERARASWGTVPDWVGELAALVDQHGLKEAGRRVGYSGPTLSQVIGNTYGASIGRIEERVRGALMGVTVDCPGEGRITRDVCLDWQDKPFAASSSHRAQMYRACRRCPISKFQRPKGEPDA